jgi:hypothetical protein
MTFEADAPEATAEVRKAKRPRPMMWVRRAHLYLGLFLFPWVLLYGVSAFLFNHAEVANKQPIARYGKSAFVGTPLEKPTPAIEIARKVVAELGQRNNESTYQLIEAEPVGYYAGATGPADLIFGSMNYPNRKIHLLFHVRATGGSLRIEDLTEVKPTLTPAPFAIIATNQNNSVAPNIDRPLLLDQTIDKHALEAIPGMMKNLGYFEEGGFAKVTQVPDLVFTMSDGRDNWLVGYNSLKGTVSGKLASEVTPNEVTWRSFMTRLHTIHGYPFAFGARWIWTVFVDVMAALMTYWAFSGLLMWWQIKSTRKIGIGLLGLSVLIAGGLGTALYFWLATPS